MNCGPCQGLPLEAKTLSHSDSYTWAMENRGPGAAKSFQEDGSGSPQGSQEMIFSDIYPGNSTYTESQVYT